MLPSSSVPISTASSAASRGEILLHHWLARDCNVERAHHQTKRNGTACRRISKRLSKTPAPLQRHQRGVVPEEHAEAMQDLIKNQGVTARPLPDTVVEALREANTNILAEAVARIR